MKMVKVKCDRVTANVAMINDVMMFDVSILRFRFFVSWMIFVTKMNGGRCGNQTRFFGSRGVIPFDND